MATTTTLVAGSIATLSSTGLNSLASGSLVVASAYSSGGGYLLAEVELVVTFGTNPSANSGVSIWWLMAPDATNYEDGGTSLTPARAPDVFLPVRAVTTLQRITVRCSIPPGTFTPLIKNDNTSQSFASSANSVKILPYTYTQG